MPKENRQPLRVFRFFKLSIVVFIRQAVGEEPLGINDTQDPNQWTSTIIVGSRMSQL